ALRASCRVNYTIDECWLPGNKRVVERLCQTPRIGHVVAHAAKGLNQLFVPGLHHQNGWGWIDTAAPIFLVTTINSSVVEDNDDHWQAVTTDGLKLHATEPERAVSLNRHNRLTANDSSGDGVPHSDTHHSPCAAIETLAGRAQLDNVPS